MSASAHRFEDEWLVRAAVAAGGADAVEKARQAKRPRLADALISEGLSAETLCEAVTDCFRVASLPRAPKTLDRLALALVPERVCRRLRLVPMRVHEERLDVAMMDPLDLHALSDVHAIAGREPVPFYLPPTEFEALLSRAFDPESVVYDLLERFSEPAAVEVLDGATHAPKVSADDVRAPVIRLVNSIIARAVLLKASDVHIEHDERHTAVRLRVDGFLRHLMTLPRHVGAGPAVARVKIMADLDISDRMRPQDGRAKLRVGAVEVGLRVSTLPTTYGEKVVIRILDKRAAEVPFEKLGFRAGVAAKISELTDSAQGLFLVTGPTGSGKTTTLYSILNRLKREDTNIVTVEDPIEYKLDGVNQVQVQEKQGLTFSSVLRSVLRQDPDVILVGEIRDRETADIALQAAQTGHLVFSTLHTNDTVSTIARLSDMGVERFKLSPALLGITAQRLVRRLCPACREELPAGEVPPAVAAAQQREGLPTRLYRPRGCPECAGTGYNGRVSLVELLEVTPELRRRIAAGDDDDALRAAARAGGWLHPLARDAAAHLAEGTTSLEEAAPHARFSAAAPDAPPLSAGAEREEPAAPAAAPGALPPIPVLRPGGESPAGAGGRKRVLVVDDHMAIRVILRSVLEKAGYDVSEAADGAEGLALIASEPPDLVLVDMHMPALDGKGLIRGVRESLGLQKLPILMLSSDKDDKTQEEALLLGADDFAHKPINPAILRARVAAVLRRASLS